MRHNKGGRWRSRPASIASRCAAAEPRDTEIRVVSWHRRKALAGPRTANAVPIIREVQRAGLKSLRAIADALNARGVGTARGGTWHASSVRDALKRVEAQT
jgi:Recombinase